MNVLFTKQQAHDEIECIFRELLPQNGMAQRPEQIRLCHSMLDAMLDGSIALCDAGTGIGKTFAYLVAGIMLEKYRAAEGDTHRPVLISTSSIALQNAIQNEYLPFLSSVLLTHGLIDRPIQAVIRKGKSHYACDMRLDRRIRQVTLSNKNPKARHALLSAKQVLDLDKLSGMSGYDRERVCVPQHCACGKEDCRYRRFLEECRNGQYTIQICNHNLLLADMIHRSQQKRPILRDSAVYIIDEAHKLPETARQMFGVTLAADDLTDLVRRLRTERFVLAAELLADSAQPLLDKLSTPVEEGEDFEAYRALLESPHHILFTSEPTEEGTVALSTAIAQVNMEYAAKLDELQAGDYDEIIVDGAPPDWREVVAVFAVRTAGADDGVDVVTLDGDRIGRLKAVFWDMTELSSEVESIEHSDSDPNDGVDDSWTETILTITITAKAVDDMRTQYAFTAQQNNTLDELLENLGLLGGLIENLSVTEADAKALLAALPEDLSAERREVLKAACSLVGKVNYFWGGKSLVLGWDSRWGTTMKVTAEGSSTTGTYRPYGLDCSGFVDWVFYNATDGSYVIGHGGGAATQHAYCTDISWNEAIPGDLVFYDDDEHIGIVGGWDENGDLLIIHCANGYNNVVITGLEGFTSIGRPNYYTECRTAPQPGRGSAYLKRKERL